MIVLQAVLPPDFPKWAQACITGSTAGNSGANSSSQWHSKIIRHGEPPGELHIQASGVEERYWSEAQVTPLPPPPKGGLELAHCKCIEKWTDHVLCMCVQMICAFFKIHCE